MREIKFRAYSHSLKKMLSFEYLQEETKKIVDLANQKLKEITNKSNISDTQFKINKLTPYGLFLPLEDDDLEFMQYTGRTDKNGKKIYDGDIVKGTISSAWSKSEIICKVVYNRDGFYCYDKRPRNEGWWEHKLMFAKDIEVIGNIYDNPELLEVKDE